VSRRLTQSSLTPDALPIFHDHGASMILIALLYDLHSRVRKLETAGESNAPSFLKRTSHIFASVSRLSSIRNVPQIGVELSRKIKE
jgi:hypothetical protein